MIDVKNAPGQKDQETLDDKKDLDMLLKGDPGSQPFLESSYSLLKRGRLNNNYSLYPKGFKAKGFIKLAAAGIDVNGRFGREVQLCEIIEETIKEMDAATRQLFAEENLYNRMARIRKSQSLEELNPGDRQFLIASLDLYQRLRKKKLKLVNPDTGEEEEKEISHRDLTA